MIQGVFSHRRRPVSLGIHLIAGAVGFLAGLQQLLSARDRRTCGGGPSPLPSAVPASATESGQEKRRDYFSIRRTKSELGYVYWVLQGHGEFQCFVLFDTWREAMDEAAC